MPPHERNGCMTAVMLAIGLLLLLPGICAIIIASFDPKEAFGDVTTLIWFLTLLAIAAGGILLLPGVCAGVFVVMSLSGPGGFSDPGFVQLWFACFLIAAGGIAMIWVAVRRLRA